MIILRLNKNPSEVIIETASSKNYLQILIWLDMSLPLSQQTKYKKEINLKKYNKK